MRSTDNNIQSNDNDQRDAFFDYFRDNLKDLETPIDDKCWEHIYKDINPSYKKSHKKRTLLVFSSGIAVAAVVLLIFMINGTSYNKFPEKEYFEADITPILHLSNGSSVKFDYIKRKKRCLLAGAVLPAKTDSMKKGHSLKNLVLNQDSITSDLCQIVLNDTCEMEKLTPTSNDKSEVKKDSVTLKKKKRCNSSYYSQNRDIQFTKRKDKRNDREGSLLASCSFCGMNSDSKGKKLLASLPSAEGDDEIITVSPNPKSNIKYDSPFSIGLLVNKRINGSFSIETGLIYSRLGTTYDDTDCKYSSIESKLYYVGIPLNFVFDVWKMNSKWKTYVNGGVTIEKGIKSVLSQYVSETKQHSRNEDIHGLQCSVSVSAGFSFQLYKNFNLYLEPKISYYFDNIQPISIRTEKKTVVGLNSGIKFDF